MPIESFPDQSEGIEGYQVTKINQEKSQSGGGMGVIEHKRNSYRISDPDTFSPITTISTNGRVEKKSKESNHNQTNEIFRATQFNEMAILRKLAKIQEKTPSLGVPKVFIEKDKIKTEYVKGVSGNELYFDDVNTALEVIRLMLEAEASLLKNDIAYLDVKPGNYKVVTDGLGRPVKVVFFDFGNAAILKNDVLVPNKAHDIMGFPPEILKSIDGNEDLISSLISSIEGPQDISGIRASIYALGAHLNLFMGQFRFSGSAIRKEQQDYNAVLELQKKMTAANPYKRIGFREVYNTVVGMIDRSKIGPCVKTATLERLRKSGEIPLEQGKEILVNEESMEQALDNSPES